MENKSKELEVAIKAARAAGTILEKYFETEILKEFKEDQSPVTAADRESEAIIKKIILEAFPEHSFIGEETGFTQNQNRYIWHVDPLDGTRNFANGIPIFGVSIALENESRLLVGVVYNSATGSLFYAEAGKGAYLNDRRIFVSKDDAAHGIITISPTDAEIYKPLLRELYHDIPKSVVRSVRDLGCTAVELAYVARGGLEGNIQLGLNTWDFAAGALLALEAGATITNHDGSPWRFPENKFIASNGLFHDKLVEVLKKQKEKLNLK